MSVTVEVPGTIQSGVSMPAAVEVAPGTVRQILDELIAQWPEVRPRLQQDSGELQRFVNIYIDDVDHRQLGGLDAVVPDRQSLVILSAVSGG